MHLIKFLFLVLLSIHLLFYLRQMKKKRIRISIEMNLALQQTKRCLYFNQKVLLLLIVYGL